MTSTIIPTKAQVKEIVTELEKALASRDLGVLDKFWETFFNILGRESWGGSPTGDVLGEVVKVVNKARQTPPAEWAELADRARVLCEKLGA